ncbi:hypothetical protein [Kitasatospora sp. NPDC101183]|uniref:hypothetical protein n=1 Tax=Kitasatospora sp. NPDC101183 TaxID=3364100 RepID=UPI0038153F57
MNSIAVKARWLGALVAAGVLLAAGAGTAGARTAGGEDGPARGVPQAVDLHAGARSVAVARDGRTAYVSVKEGGRHGAGVKVVDTRSGAVTADVTLTTGFDASAGPVALSPDGSRAYVLYSLGHGLRLSLLGVIDTATNTLVATAAAPDQPRPAGAQPGSLGALSVSADGSRVLVTQYGPAGDNGPTLEGTRVLQFSPAQLAYTAAVTVPGHFTGAVVSRPGGGDAYVATDEGLVHLNTSGAAPVAADTVAFADGAFAGLAISPDGSRLYGVNGSGRGLAVDLATETTVAVFDVTPGTWVRDLSVSADGTRLYLLAQDSSVLSIDTATDAVLPGEGVKGLTGTGGLAVGPDGHTFYVTSGTSLLIIGF